MSAMRSSAHGFMISDRINKMDKIASAKSVAADSVDSVHSVEKPLPNSRRVYVGGKIHPDIRVPFREILLAPTKSMSGEIEVNEPVRVYDTSGPWGDPDFYGDVTQGLPALRAKWIRDRGDVQEHDGRKVQPIDDGFLSDKHARLGGATSPKALPNAFGERVPPLNAQRRPLRARAGRCVTQLAYARRGIITPEMEFIAVREQMWNAECGVRNEEHGAASKHSEFRIPNSEFARNDLAHQHPGESFGANKIGRAHV